MSLSYSPTEAVSRRPQGTATIAAWSAVALLSCLLLPWVRSGANIVAYDFQWTGLALIGRDGLVALIVALIACCLLLSFVRPGKVRGLMLSGASLACLIAAGVWLSQKGMGFAPGAALLFLGMLAVLGAGLSYSRLLDVDPFIAIAIVWVAGLIVTLIVWPLFAVLEASVIVRGRFTLSTFVQTLKSPTFFLLDNPWTELDEGATALRAGFIGALCGLLYSAYRLATGRMWKLGGLRIAGTWLKYTLGAGLAGYVIVALITGFGALRNSVLLAVCVGAVSTVLGLCFALLGERTRLPIRKLMAPISTLSMITPPFVLGLAMIYVFGRRGFITHTVLGLSTNAFFGLLGVGVAQVLAFTPLAYLVLSGVVQSLDASVEEAAQTLRSSRWRVYRTVVWPLVRPGVANAFLLGVIESLADFGNPIILGGGRPFLPTEVFYAIDGRFNQNEAAVYGVILLIMTLCIFVVQHYWIGKASYVTVTGKPTGARATPLPRPLEMGMAGIFALWAILSISLYVSIFFGSFVKLWGINNEFTLQNYFNLSPSGWGVLANSVRTGALAAVPAALLGFMIAYLVGRFRFPGRGLLEFSSMLSFAIPGTVMGIGYILAFNSGPLYMTRTELIVILAFIFRNMPVGIRSGVAALQQIDPSLEEASTTLRASTAKTIRKIVFPLLLPSVIAGLMFSFVRSMTAISQVIFLVTPGLNLATVLVLSWVEKGDIGRGAALSSVMIAIMAAVVLVLNGVVAYMRKARQGARI